MGLYRLTQRCICILALTALSLVAHTDAFCYRANPPKVIQDPNAQPSLIEIANYTTWICVQSKDPMADLDKAPKPNVTRIWFSMSQLEKLKAEAFTKFAEKLVKIEIWRSRLAEIDDDAFKGLTELKGLILPRNELTIVKAAWFKDTSKLLELNLSSNRIRSVEIDFLKHLPALINLDLRDNELISLPVDFIKQLPTTLRLLNLYSNPLNCMQMMEAVEWSMSKDNKIKGTESQLKHVFNVTKSCLEDKTIDKTGEAIDKCVEDKMNNEIDLIAQSNKTNNATDKV